MKQERIFNLLARFFIVFFIILLMPKALSGQTYCYQFVEKVVGSKLEVEVRIIPSSEFNLGYSKAKFSYNTSAVLATPITYTSALPNTYTVVTDVSRAGLIDLTVDYIGATGAGTLIPETGFTIGKFTFTLSNPSILLDFKIAVRLIKEIQLRKDDNTTILAISAQCIPSPYTSLFYDVNVELNADIPMDECVDANTPFSVKIPTFTDDETREVLPPGFKFTFYCEEVTSLRLGADGALLVNASPTATLPSNNDGMLKSLPKVIAPLWDEWRRGMGSINCLVRTLPSGQRMLIIQWNDVSPLDETNPTLNTDPMKATFNVVIYENSSIIKFNYKDIDYLQDAGVSTNATLRRLANLKRFGADGSVGMKGPCATGESGDGVNNVLFDGPTGVSLFDVRTRKVYKSITFLPISDACTKPNDVDLVVCQNAPAFKLPIVSTAINGTWKAGESGMPYIIGSKTTQAATFNPTTVGTFNLEWVPDCALGYKVRIIVNQPATVNAGSPQTICSSDKANLIGTIGGGASTVTWSAPANTGVFNNKNALTPTFTPSIKSGTVTLTLSTNDPDGDGPCSPATSTVNITVIEAADAGLDGSRNICSNNRTGTFNLFDIISGAQRGGTWVRVSGTGGVFNATAATFQVDATTTNSIFRYKVLGTAPCPDDESLAAFNIISAPNAGQDVTTAVCENSTTAINLSSLLVGGQSGGAWTRLTGTGGVFSSSAGTFTPSIGATSSTFRYFVAGFPPCVGNDESIITINISTQVYAGTDGERTICSNSPQTINLFDLIENEQANGTWTRTSGTGGNFSATAATFTPSVNATTSTFQYTITGVAPCPTDFSVVTINIVPLPNAGPDGGTTICETSTTPINLASFITGGQSGGVWMRLTGTGGNFNASTATFTPAANATTNSTFKYTVSNGTVCNQMDDAIVSVNVATIANAGNNGSLTVCSSDTRIIDLSKVITDGQAGGIWKRLTGTGGVFTVSTGTFNPVPNATSSTFQYTVAGGGACPDDFSIATVIFQAPANAGPDQSRSICDNIDETINLKDLIGSGQTGGSWERISGAGGTFNPTNATFKIARGATTSQFRYTVLGIFPCPNDESIITITINPAPYAGLDDGTILCDYVTTPINLFVLIDGEQLGGTWTRISGTGGTFNAGAGTFTLEKGAKTSKFQYFLPATAFCPADISIATIAINAQAYAGEDGFITLCNASLREVDLNNLIENEQPNGTWTRVSGTGGSFVAATGKYTPSVNSTNSVFKYTVLGQAPCANDESFANVNQVAQPYAGTDGTLKLCDNALTAIKLADLIDGEQADGVWTRVTGTGLGTGGVFTASTAMFTPPTGAAVYKFRYTITASSPCVDDFAEVTITINRQPFAGPDVSITICDNSTNPIDLFSLLTNAHTGGYWNRLTGLGGSFNAVTGTFTPSINATNSSFQYSINGQAPCINDDAVITIIIKPTQTPVFDPITICQNQMPIPLLPNTSKNGISGTWSPQFIDLQTSRTHTFTAANGVCITPTTLTVTVNPLPVVNAGPDQTFCDNAAPLQYAMDGSPIPTGGTGEWTIENPANGAIITNKNDPKTTVVGLQNGKSAVLKWTVTNSFGCSNSDNVLLGKDGVAPTIETYNKSSALAGIFGIGPNGEALVCADIVIKNLSDNCTSYADLFKTVTIVKDNDNPSRMYSPDFPKCVKVTCNDLLNKVSTQVWVVDKAGNASYSTTILTIQDNMGFCAQRAPQAMVAIATASNLPVKNVQISATMSGQNQSQADISSNNSGLVEINNLTFGENYTLKANKTDDQYWGVTTFDIAVISQHVLGIKPITSPYNLLAADVNEDGEIDANDILTMRNFILRRSTNLPRRDWRFMDSSYNFIQPSNPFNEDVPELIQLEMASNTNRKAFKAIKKGDVTGELTQSLPNLTALSTRSNRQLTVQTEDIWLEKGKTYALNFTAEDFNAVAYQFTLFTEGVLKVQNIQAGDLPKMSDANFALFDNAITTSWYGETLEKMPKMFIINILAQKSGALSQALKLGSFITPAEANDANGETMPVKLIFTNRKTTASEFSLYQNYPNPFGDNTTIGFTLPKEDKAVLTLYNLEGKTILVKKIEAKSGLNEVAIPKSELNTSGILYYRLETPDFSATKKMVIIGE